MFLSSGRVKSHMDTFITKGTKVLVQFLKADLNASIAGSQPKFAATQISFLGTVRHVRGNAPTQEASKDIRFWVEPDADAILPKEVTVKTCEKCGKPEVGMLKESYLYLPK